MLENMLSPRGFKIYFAVFLAMFGYVMWHRIADTGIVAWIDQFQSEHIFGGTYYPKMSVLILCFPIVLVCFVVGFLHDFAFGLGVFSSGERHDKTRNG